MFGAERMSHVISRATVKWGASGAVGVVLVGGLLVAVQETARFGSPLQKLANHVWLVIASPVLWMWETLGVRGAEDLRILIPMLVSVFLFLASLGFIGGVILRKTANSE